MDAEEQTSLIFDMMIAIAPEVARHHLRILDKHSAVLSEETLEDLRRRTARTNANVTLEFAMHLAGVFAQCQASANETKPTQAQQETPPAGKPRKAKPPERIQPAAAGVPEGTSPVSDLSRTGDRGAPQTRPDRSEAQ